MTIAIYVNDVLNWYKHRDGINIGDFELSTTRKRETRYASFTVRYYFNNYKSKYRGQKASDELNRL